MKFFCFRFDVDTERCIAEGIPNLLNLSKKTKTSFTFFFNMGRGISKKAYLNRKKSGPAIAAKLSNYKKLGIYYYLRTIFLNPNVGLSYKKIIQDTYQQGHEVGLHGGKNHGEWMYNAQTWNKNHFFQEIKWGLEQMKQLNIENISSFSSPGWQTTITLQQVLKEFNFQIIADEHGELLEDIVDLGNNLYSIPTNFAGEPEGVGYFENKCAQGLTDDEFLNNFSQQLDNIKKLGVLYDHPYYAGIQKLDLLEKTIETVKEKGFIIKTMQEIYHENNICL